MRLKPAAVIIVLAATLGAAAPRHDFTGRGGPRMAEDDGAPWLLLEPRRDVLSSWHGAASSRQAVKDGGARGLSLAKADFDEDGMPDVVAGYASGQGGLFALHRGNVDAVYPNAPEAQERRKAGTFTSAPFLPDADIFETPERADFIGAGDFDADGHWDVVTAARGGEALFLHLGNGQGGFAEAERIALPGRVTSFVTGEINRRDGLTDIVVGVSDSSGARALVFEGPDGALRRDPEVVALPAPATEFVLDRLDGDWALDLAAAAGSQLVIVHGRDRKLSYEPPKGTPPVADPTLDAIDLGYEIEALATGDFDGDQRRELALLDAAGGLHVHPVADLASLGSDASKRAVATPLGAPWKGAGRPALFEARRSQLVPARISSLPGDDLVLVDAPGRRLNVRMAAGDPPEQAPWAASARAQAGAWVSREVTGRITGILPMRLNSDALTDLAVLSEEPEGLGTMDTGIATIITVTNTNDSGAGSLRDAITLANSLAGPDSIVFDIPGTGPHRIDLQLHLPVSLEPVTIDATTQMGYAGTPQIWLYGLLISSQNFAAMRIHGGSSLVRGIAFSWFHGSSVTDRAAAVAFETLGGNILENCFFGTNPAGTLQETVFEIAVTVNGTSSDTIGGTTSAARNLFSGMQDCAPALLITGASLTLVQGNYFGTKIDGVTPLPNTRASGAIGITARSMASDVTIGGTVAGAGNVISGTGTGTVNSGGGEVSGWVVQGNLIGLGADGVTEISGSLNGVSTGGYFGAGGPDTIGGTSPAARNVISGNSDRGIWHRLSGSAVGTVIQGNYIGTDITGTLAKGNQIGIDSTNDNYTIGGTAAGARNVIADSFDSEIALIGVGTVVIQGNFIGTNASGDAVLGSSFHGIVLDGYPNAMIGGTVAGSGNVISGHLTAGITFRPLDFSGGTAYPHSNTIQGNLIGTDVTGTLDLGNGTGIQVLDGAYDNYIGTDLAYANVISGNNNGILMSGSTATGNLVRGNLIGTDVSGMLPLSNSDFGIWINGAPGNTIGGSSSGERNVISSNSTDGVRVEGAGAAGNILKGNYIGLNVDGLTILANGVGVHLLGESTTTDVGVPGEPPNVISGNSTGVRIEDATSSGHRIRNNYIGTDASGTLDLGNGVGMWVTASGGNIVGGPAASDRNVISGNGNNLLLESVYVTGGVTANTIEGNYFGLTADALGSLGSSASNAVLLDTQGTTFRDNIVLGSGTDGLNMLGAWESTVTGNWFGLDPSFTVFPGNGRNGIQLTSSWDNTIGGLNPPDWNIIAGSTQDGITLDATSFSNEIRGNQISFNGEMGIDIEDDGVTANDPGDPDFGGNNRQNFPVLTSATTTSGSGTVMGTLDSTPGSSFLVEVYHDTGCNASGHGEGFEPIGVTTVNTDGSGTGAFSLSYTAMVNAADIVSATATNIASGDTSEFSMCQGLTGTAPAPMATAGFSSPGGLQHTLSWDPEPGATMYHVYRGTLGTMPLLASAPLDSCEWGATSSTSISTSLTEVPPPGEMLWYMIRPEGPYGLGEVDESSSGPRDQGSIGACGASCAHDKCVTDGALTSPCDPCVTIIGQADPFCVTSGWDLLCVQEVRTVCRSLSCSESQGTCPHTLCTAGGPLSPGCDTSTCVTDICTRDPFCCSGGWDDLCVGAVSVVCDMNCL